MDHAEAVRSQAADKYLLGELSDNEAEEFERHYFSCPECTSDVETGTVFVENARAVFREWTQTAPAPAPPQEPRRGLREVLADFWRRPAIAVPAMAALALALLSAYQGLVLIPGLKRAALSGPLQIATFQLVEAVRGDEKEISVQRGAAAFAVSFDPAWETPFPQYRCELRDGSGSLMSEVPALPPAPGQPITILLPAERLLPGNYSLAVHGIRSGGGEPSRLATYSFRLRFH